ncbi:DUF938 domain-containing protein [Spirulina sp. CCNP1310]|uniref:DUF938 domain-containing protein n=1 Tax=Spirulina sp. CCNP1310 TaxID=3110249 RepID=UPI002B1EBFB9|nr:DUF938 domain-containing protein [Spirulina sp. CCNP1310]MEA5418812.1 DUF938 domain-containing protein [Spirulina sp. CCNP1310]
MVSAPDRRQYAPATERNRDPILKVLQQVLPPQGTILEIASGTGQHAIYFAPALAPRLWLPSEFDPELQASILAWRHRHPAANLMAPIVLDAGDRPWSIEAGTLPPDCTAADLQREPISAIIAINLIHIAPWSVALGLLAGASRLLPSGGILYLYGPFIEPDKPLTPSNLAFHQSLQFRNPAWGLRDLGILQAAAEAEGLQLQQVSSMPANNLSVVLRK